MSPITSATTSPAHYYEMRSGISRFGGVPVASVDTRPVGSDIRLQPNAVPLVQTTVGMRLNTVA
jgi:hypothetical protein